MSCVAATCTNKPRSHQHTPSTNININELFSSTLTKQHNGKSYLEPITAGRLQQLVKILCQIPNIIHCRASSLHFGSSKDLYMCWYRQHYRKRHRRSSEECPSHKRAPVRRRDPSTLPSKLRYSRLPSHRQSAFTQKISAYLSRIISTSPLDHFSGL